MKATELRIGNFVKDRGGKTIKIDFIEYVRNGYDTKFGQLMYLEGEEVHPMTEYSDYAFAIPLTEEWLFKFGFIKLDNNKYGIGTDNNEYWIEFVMDRVFFFIAAYMDSPPSVSVKYVHQLQNLYFALTGEELTQVSEGENKNFV